MYAFHKTVREHIKYGDIHASIIFPNFFDIFKFILRLKEAYTPGTKSPFPQILASQSYGKKKHTPSNTLCLAIEFHSGKYLMS
jgi:hypothetical protein